MVVLCERRHRKIRSQGQQTEIQGSLKSQIKTNKTKKHGETREREGREQVVTSGSPLPSLLGNITEKRSGRREGKTQVREMKQHLLDLLKWLTSELKQPWLLPKARIGLG